jgi:O-antigen ligase
MPNAGQGGDEVLLGVFAGMFGALLGLSLLKFGNAVILEEHISYPQGALHWLIDAWPPAIGYGLLVLVAAVGALVARARPGVPRAIVVLPAAWLAWQIVSGTQSIDRQQSHEVLIHFAACVGCFYLGLFSLSRVRSLRPFWLALLACFAVVLLDGFEQHFGGLAETRKFFYEIYVYPHPNNPPPRGLMERMGSNRIFSTLFYPNTLAGAILLLLPVTLAVIASMKRRFTEGARRGLMVIACAAALGCLYWSGSKGGWLLMLLTGLIAVLFVPIRRQVKLIVVVVALVLGLTGFGLKYAGFFRKGATSVVARFDYWHYGVWQGFKEKPVFGSGPGTFGKTYTRLKKPEAEPTMLAHNDYLQQAPDSGAPGFLLYAALVVSAVVFSYRRAGLREDWVKLAVWLGLLAWSLESCVEFNLYIPALAWPAFAFMGWLLGQSANPSTAAAPPAKVQPAQ